MAEYVNYIGRKINNIEKLKQTFDSFNHMIELEPQQVFSVSLRGWFYNNIFNGDNYVISQYGIAKFGKSGLDWIMNSENAIEKFLRVSKKVSDSFNESDNIYDKKSNVHEKLGL